MGIGDYPNFVGPNERHLHSVPEKERKQMALRVMNADELLTVHPEAHESMIEDDSERDEQEDDWSAWQFADGFEEPVPPETVIAKRLDAALTSEGLSVWTGTRWIDSGKGDLTEEEEALMDAVAAQCPSGLSDWS